jgi:predicted ArsR family transcriptional regulator
MKRLCTDDELRERVRAHLKVHGPQRTRTLANNAGLPYNRTLALLPVMVTEGLLEEVPGGVHRGVPCSAYQVPGERRALYGSARPSFGGALALEAMQAAARARLIAQSHSLRVAA